VRVPSFANLGHRGVVEDQALWQVGRRTCFAAFAGAADVLAGGPIRSDLQAHLAVLAWRSSHRPDRKMRVVRGGRLDKNPCWDPELDKPGADLGLSAEVQTGPGSRLGLPFSPAAGGRRGGEGN